jgi:hypothetical protein
MSQQDCQVKLVVSLEDEGGSMPLSLEQVDALVFSLYPRASKATHARHVQTASRSGCVRVSVPLAYSSSANVF